MQVTAAISNWGILLAPLVAVGLLANELYGFIARDWFRLLLAIVLVILLMIMPLSVWYTFLLSYSSGPVGP